jgi:predicted branched-subunit amino acid permease
MIYGVLARSAGLPAGLAQAISAIIFAGSAQFITIQLVASSTPLLPIVVTAIVVNLRHALYSASLAPFVQPLPRRWKLLLAYLLTDEAYAVTILRYQEEDRRRQAADRKEDLACPRPDLEPSVSTLQPANISLDSANLHYFFFGSGLALWVSWQISTAAGIFLGTQIPASWSLDFTLALTFIALVVPALKDRPAIVAALAGGTTAVLAVNLPLRLGLVMAALVGVLAGLWGETAGRKTPEEGRGNR